jgi:hypothetical protein
MIPSITWAREMKIENWISPQDVNNDVIHRPATGRLIAVVDFSYSSIFHDKNTDACRKISIVVVTDSRVYDFSRIYSSGISSSYASTSSIDPVESTATPCRNAKTCRRPFTTSLIPQQRYDDIQQSAECASVFLF